MPSSAGLIELEALAISHRLRRNAYKHRHRSALTVRLRLNDHTYMVTYGRFHGIIEVFSLWCVQASARRRLLNAAARRLRRISAR